MQEHYVSAGLAVGILYHEEESFRHPGKVKFEIAFSSAWSRFPRKKEFRAINNEKGRDPYHQMVPRDFARARKHPGIALVAEGGDLKIKALRSLALTLSFLDDSGVPRKDWYDLAERFLSHLLDDWSSPHASE